MTETRRIVYVCSQCLRVTGEPDECHGRPMIACDAGAPGDERSRPVTTPDGELVTHAPRWWVEQCLMAQRQRKK